MSIETAVLFAMLAVAVAIAAAVWRGRLQARLARLEAELERQSDALWEARDREERAREQGERALAEAEARAAAGARAKSKFLATVTHEMRTPLSGVIGTTDLLLESALAPDQRTYARAVKQSAQAMLSLVDEILDLSRIEADRVTLQDAPFEVAGLVEGVAELLAPRAQAKGLDLAVRIALDVPPELIGDAARIRQILLNLAANAIKFTKRGGVGVSVSVDAAAEIVRFAVVDTGPGFDPAEAERLFEEFEQSAADPAVGGVGLGLAISRRIALAMAGAIAATATPCEGAVFTLTLPLRPAGARLAAPANAEAALAGRSVAVVTAAPFGGPWLVERLGEWGAAARLISPGVDPDHGFGGTDIVLIDKAAGESALSLAAAARRSGASRVLLMLSPSERRDLPTLAADGFDGYLVKPIRSASLLSRLVDPRAEQAAPATEPVQAISFSSLGGLRALLAEDDPVSALIALAHLARLGHSATHVADGEAACAAFERERYDVVLLDLRMPAADGCEAAARMRRIEAAAGRPRCLIMAVSANVSPEDREAALAAGMDDLLAKPLERKTLEARLRPPPSSGSKVA